MNRSCFLDVFTVFVAFFTGCHKPENNVATDLTETSREVLVVSAEDEAQPRDSVPVRESYDFNDSTPNFKRYLDSCGPDEIRCLWFLDDDRNVGMVLTIDLQQSSAFQVREVYNWAHQASRRHDLTPDQIANLRGLVEQLPASDESVEFNRAVSVSVQRGGKANVFQYDRRNPPDIIRRLYDSARGQFDDVRAD